MDRRQFVRLAALSGAAAVSAALTLPGCSGGQAHSRSASVDSRGSSTEESAQQGAAASTPAVPKIVVACFSATGNTRAVAQIAAAHLGADYLEIEPEIPYTQEDLDYGDETTRATAEQNDVDARPALASTPEFSGYDVMLLGHPIWWGKAPRLICTLLESADLTGKAVAEFCTSGSSGIEGAAAELQEIAPEAQWIGARRFAASAPEDEMAEWTDSLSIG